MQYDKLYLYASKSWRTASLICRTEPTNKKSNAEIFFKHKKNQAHAKMRRRNDPVKSSWSQS